MESKQNKNQKRINNAIQNRTIVSTARAIATYAAIDQTCRPAAAKNESCVLLVLVPTSSDNKKYMI